jgi:hypothetical protein
MLLHFPVVARLLFGGPQWHWFCIFDILPSFSNLSVGTLIFAYKFKQSIAEFLCNFRETNVRI